jgi:hypothetical protein
LDLLTLPTYKALGLIDTAYCYLWHFPDWKRNIEKLYSRMEEEKKKCFSMPIFNSTV